MKVRILSFPQGESDLPGVWRKGFDEDSDTTLDLVSSFLSFQRAIVSQRLINMACHRHGSSFPVLPKSLFPVSGKMDSEHQASGQVTTISNRKQGIITRHSIRTVMVARVDQALANKVCCDSQEMRGLAIWGVG